MAKAYEAKKLFAEAHLAEAKLLFGFSGPLEELEGSSFVYEGESDGRRRILKISPGLLDPRVEDLGATPDQVRGELDFVAYLGGAGVPLALPVPSVRGEYVETIPAGGEFCFIAAAYEKAPGIMYPDDDIVEFPEVILEEWGRVMGMIHRLSAAYEPSEPAWIRPAWDRDDSLDFEALYPPDHALAKVRCRETLASLRAMPSGREDFGLIHGDLHHGNFFADGDRVIAFDFDAACRSWFAVDVATALYNCLPMPRSLTEERRAYCLRFLPPFLRGYRREKAFDGDRLARMPLIFKYREILNYSYFLKYWDLSDLSERRAAVVADVRRRIEEGIPVVEFREGDLEL